MATALRRRPPAATDDAGKVQPIPVPLAARKGKTWPRAIDQIISEPSSIIGDLTGTKYSTLSEHAPEALTIAPLKGVKHYSQGGTIALADSAVDNAYETERQNAAASLRAEQAVQAAARDTANKEAVGLAQTVQNTEDQTYAQLGVAKPADIAVAPGGTAPGSGGPMTRVALQTKEQIAADQAQQVNRQGALSNQIAQANASQARDVESRQRQAIADAEKAHRDRGEVQDDNGNWVSSSSYRMQQAQSAPTWDPTTRTYTTALIAHQHAPVSDAELPPGQVRDPDTGNIVTPAQARILAAERGVVYDDVNKRFTTHADINARTDAAGNIRRDDGTWVSKQGNELRNGVWTDPTTGNVLIDRDTWQSPQGFKFHITNHDTGSGYWEDPDGFTLGADGVWTNHATGAQKINGVIYSPQQLSAYRSTRQAASAGYNLDDTAAADEGTTDYALTP